MPKVLDCSPEKMAETARKILLEQGVEACTIRAVAKACGTSVGTVYTHFPSKNVLMVRAVSGEWFRALEVCRAKSQECSDPEEGIARFYRDMLAFGMKYRGVFLQLIFDGKDSSHYREGHRMLVRQVRESISPLLTETQAADDALMDFLANVIIAYVRNALMEQSDGEYDQIRPMISRLLR